MRELQDFLDSIEGLNETDKCIQWLHFTHNHTDERIDKLEDEVDKLEKKLSEMSLILDKLSVAVPLTDEQNKWRN